MRYIDFPNAGRSKIGLAFCYFIWWIYTAVVLMADNADVFHVQSLFGYLPVIAANFAKRRLVIYDLIDLAADSFRLGRLSRRAVTWFENFCLQFADGVIVVDVRKQQLDTRHVRRLAVVANCPREPPDLRPPERRNAHRFTVYYGGALLEGRGLAHLCEAVSGLKGVDLVIAGTGPFENALRARYGRNSNVTFRGLLSERESLELTMKADLVFAFYDPSIPINARASPAKMYDAMMCGVPVLANQESVLVADTLTKAKCGVVVPYHDVDRIRHSIEELMETPGLAAELGKNGRKMYEEQYNWRVMESRLLEMYAELLSTSSTALSRR